MEYIGRWQLDLMQYVSRIFTKLYSGSTTMVEDVAEEFEGGRGLKGTLATGVRCSSDCALIGAVTEETGGKDGALAGFNLTDEGWRFCGSAGLDVLDTEEDEVGGGD